MFRIQKIGPREVTLVLTQWSTDERGNIALTPGCVTTTEWMYHLSSIVKEIRNISRRKTNIIPIPSVGNTFETLEYAIELQDPYEEGEKAYRRGYRDGWAAVVATLEKLNAYEHLDRIDDHMTAIDKWVASSCKNMKLPPRFK